MTASSQSRAAAHMGRARQHLAVARAHAERTEPDPATEAALAAAHAALGVLEALGVCPIYPQPLEAQEPA